MPSRWKTSRLSGSRRARRRARASAMGCEIGRIRPTNVFERAGESRMTPPTSSISSRRADDRARGDLVDGEAVEEAVAACPSRIRCQAATGSWTKSRQWEIQRTLFSSAQAPCNVASILDSARELGIRDAQAARLSQSTTPACVPGPCVVPWPCRSVVHRIDHVDPLIALSPRAVRPPGPPEMHRPEPVSPKPSLVRYPEP